MSELRKNSPDPDGAGQSWKTCLWICGGSFPESSVFRCRTSGTCTSYLQFVSQFTGINPGV